jgi:mRNA-degrading endonuclease RelE of RelBE toxin-antitoxin system
MEDLREDPSVVPAIELRRNPGTWRARFHHDRFRIVYQILKAQKLIIVRRIRPRPTAYIGMKH